MRPDDAIDLARAFVEREFVRRGMVGDLNVHCDIGDDGLPRPHAHVTLTLREMGADGFCAKARDSNSTVLLEHWREAWAEHVNVRLAELDQDIRIDHRSLKEQGVDLEPQFKTGLPPRDLKRTAGPPNGSRSIATSLGVMASGCSAILPPPSEP